MGSRRKPIPEKIQGRLTKFFVSNLPEKCSGNDLAEFVRQHGEIFDLYIARKRDRSGNRFGFVTMLDVKDKQEMVRILYAIRMGDYRLRVNVARFTLEDGEINTGYKAANDTVVGSKKKDWRSFSFDTGKAPMLNPGGGSFKETLTGRHESAREDRVVVVGTGLMRIRVFIGEPLLRR
ncbi:putative RNA recognition motif domain, nucleotide-binding alpha-beta plait domain superfamily [Helianthus annuus]|nr:putative RNA recognition motif domain, nucleotide-binding alpha-beta plait domain superfamily [Helianthus annuus]